jgi:hypothetical protein
VRGAQTVLYYLSVHTLQNTKDKLLVGERLPPILRQMELCHHLSLLLDLICLARKCIPIPGSDIFDASSIFINDQFQMPDTPPNQISAGVNYLGYPMLPGLDPALQALLSRPPVFPFGSTESNSPAFGSLVSPLGSALPQVCTFQARDLYYEN